MELSQSPFLIMDCQTTGLSPRRAEILEIGWSFSFEANKVESQVIKPTQTEKIPRTVWEMTGLSLAEVEKGQNAEDTWRNILTAAEKIGPEALVIHYSQFELPFLTQLHEKVTGESALPWSTVCTYRVAQKLHQDLPAKTIRALSGHLGFEMPETQRSQNHVAATQNIWRALLETLREQESVSSFLQFQEWFSKPAEKRKSGPRKYLLPREQRLDLPSGPGVYQMYSRRGKLLYVGKATSLRSRVNSYFTQKRTTRKQLKELVTQVADVKVIETDSALEAALLENDLIKRHRPPYNYSLKNTSRKLYYAAKNLTEVSPEFSQKFPWGPINSRKPFESLELLQLLLNNQIDQINPAYLKYPAVDLKECTEKVLKEMGVFEFESLTLFDLHRLGKRLVPRPVPENEIEASVHRKLKRSTKQLHDANWLCWFTDCRVAWQREGKWRALTFSQGELIARDEVAEPPSRFERKRVPLSERRAAMDNLKHDRVRILLTDLTTMMKRGQRVRVEFSATRVFDSQETSRFSEVLRRSREGGE